MITLQEWKAMNGKEQTMWMEENRPTNKLSIATRGHVHGVGINDVAYLAHPKIDGKKVACPAYRAWESMLNRCYGYKWPTYIGVTVCNEWLSFSAFRRWWIEHQVDGFALDKDILCDSLEYSPYSCMFVPQWLNNFITDSNASRGSCPIGVDLDKRRGKFRARCGNPTTGKSEYLGMLETKAEAYAAWRTRKLELAIELKPKMDEIDQRIYPRVIEIINNAK